MAEVTDVAVICDTLFVTNYGAGTLGEYTVAGATVNASLITGLNNGPFAISMEIDFFILEHHPSHLPLIEC